MAINLSDSIRVGQQKPIDDKYYNNLSVYTSTSQVNTLILSSVRYRGLTVNINGEEYWYKDGIDDTDLILKSSGTNLNGTGVVKSTAGTISYINGTSSQFIKGDGSLDSNIYLTTISGLNISLLNNDSGYITASALSPYLTSATAASTYFPIPTGTTSEYIRGNGTVATFPTALPPSGTAGGDLNGTYPNPTVDGLQGNPVSNTAPSNGQILQWNGSAWTPGTIPNGGSGGGGQVYFFNYQNVTGISPITGLPTTPVSPSQLGVTYNPISNSIDSANLTQGTYTLVCGFVTIVGTPGVTTIPAGLWDFNIWADVVGGTGGSNQTQFQIRVYKYDGSTAPTLLASSIDIFIYDPTVLAQYIGNVTMPQTTILATDRIYIEFWAQKNVNQSRRISFHFGTNTPSHVHTTLPSVSGTGLVKVVNGVYQTPATSLVNADVDANAAITVSKLAMNTNRLLGRTTVGSGSVEEIELTTTGISGAATLVGNTLNIPVYAGTTAYGYVSRTITLFTATASQTTFNVAYTIGSLDVYMNGVKLSSSEYTATSGTSIVLNSAAVVNDIIEVIAYSASQYLPFSATSPIAYNDITGVISHVSTDGNLHVPATGTTNNGKVLTAGPTAGSLSWENVMSLRQIINISTPTPAGNVSNTDYVYLVSGTTTLTLPTAVGNTNKYTIKKVGTGVVSIATIASQTIDGSNSPITINVQYVSIDIISDGTNWNII